MKTIYTKSNGKTWYAGRKSMIKLMEAIQQEIGFDRPAAIKTECKGFACKVFHIQEIQAAVDSVLKKVEFHKKPSEFTTANREFWDGVRDCLTGAFFDRNLDVREMSEISSDMIINEVLGCFKMSNSDWMMIPTDLSADHSPIN